MKIYAFQYCDCIYESGFVTQGLYVSAKGAYTSMRKFIQNEYTEWFDRRTKYGKKYRRGHKAFEMCAFQIERMLVQE